MTHHRRSPLHEFESQLRLDGRVGWSRVAAGMGLGRLWVATPGEYCLAARPLELEQAVRWASDGTAGLMFNDVSDVRRCAPRAADSGSFDG